MRDTREGLESLDALDLANRIYEIGMLANQSGDLDDVIRAIVKRILEETGADYVGIGLVNEQGERIMHAWGCTREGEWVPPQQLQVVGDGVTGTVAKTGKPLYIEDVSKYPNYYPLIEGIQSEMAVPLTVGERIIGTLDIESRVLGKFGRTELAMLQIVANPVALAIHNAKLFHDARRRLEQLRVLNRVSSIITSTIDLTELLERTVDVIREQLGYHFVGLGLAGEDPNRVYLRAISTDMPVNLTTGHSQGRGVGVAGEVFDTGRSLLIPDVTKWENYIVTGDGLRSEMCCPIKVGTKTIGILNASSTVPGALDRSDLLVLETVADHIAQAVENARNLQESARMREDLARMVIHDLRNPLTVIETTLNYIENILNAQADSGLTDKTRRYVENAKAACERLFVMINGMLELQRIEAGELELDSMPAVGAEIVNDVVETLSIVASAMQVDLMSGVREKGLMVYIDRDLITRVLENLVANALKFTPEGGQVTVNASAAPRELMDERLPHVKEGVLFTVRDTGPGIKLADRERIFEKFARADTDTEDRRRGSGLGLAFCREAIRAHGGAIWVESEPGKGSTFCFVIPRVMGSLWP